MTTAIVLSGGGNRGPLQVGALESLFRHGIMPDFLVGTSAGSINGGFCSAHGPGLACVEALAEAWRRARPGDVYPGGVLRAAWRVLSGADSLFPGNGLRRLIQDNLPPGVTTFGQLRCPLYVTAVDLRSRRLFLFGEDPAAPLVDAIVASSSIPAMHPPVPYHGLQLVDGGVVASAPASIAMDRGATVLYVVNLGSGDEILPPARGVIGILGRTLDTFISQSLLADLERATGDPAIELHHIQITAFGDVAFNDFSQVDAMIAAGRRATDAYLAHPQPRLVAPERGIAPAPTQSVPGAREYIVPTRRER